MKPEIKLIMVKPDNSEIREQVAAEQIGENLFKLIENPILSEHVNYGTIVRVESDSKGNLVMTGIISKSGFITTRLLLPIELQDAKTLNEIAQPIIDAGGFWETAMGGVLFIHLPNGSKFHIGSLFSSRE